MKMALTSQKKGTVVSFLSKNRGLLILLALFAFGGISDLSAASTDTAAQVVAQGSGTVQANTDLDDIFATVIFYVRWFGYIAGIFALFGGGWLFYNGKMSQGGIAAASSLFLFNLGKIVGQFKPEAA